MKLYREKKRLIITTMKEGAELERGWALKFEWAKVGFIGFVFRRDLRGFTLNFFAWWSLHVSLAIAGSEKPDAEVKLYGGYLVPRDSVVTWMWRFNGGNSQVSDPGLYREWNYADALLGRPAFSERSLGTFQRVLEMPEGPYWLKITLDEGSWKRPRWPWARRQYRARLEVEDEGEIPVPMPDGKESGTYGETRNGLKSRNLEKILKDYKRDLIEERRLVTGDADWRPSNAEIGKS